MANVKPKNKRLLEEFQAKLVLLKGKKISQQEILDKCIEFSEHHLKEFVNEKIDTPKLTPERKERIISNSIEVPIYYTDKTDDEIIYGI
jgi:hypothetical protein